MRFLLFLTAAAAYAGPCTSTKDCTEWVTLGGGPSRSMIYRTYSLEKRNPAISRALIMVHGVGRDADNYFRSAIAAAFLADALEDTLVIAPRFTSNATGGCRDTLQPGEVSWSCSGDSWKSGGVAVNTERLTSFDFIDEILRKLARNEIFPNLRAIVVAGHSAGGQFADRYAMSNHVHETLGVALSYVVANPSSYAWPDATRPAEDVLAKCPLYDRWPYGFINRTGYAGPISDDQLRKQLASRPVTYLLGELDTLPIGGFDQSCPAMAQGPTRRARGEAFADHVNQKYGAQHAKVLVPYCGHNGRCMFTSEQALPVLFPSLKSQHTTALK
jgi:pimeloyl-ACP methyl ester carboxylesterase